MLKKSVIIAGRHYTSISIEKEFYLELEHIAKENNLSINQIVSEIDSHKNEKNNLSSAVRIFVLNYLKEKATHDL